ncbi:hypothetical protein L596_029309 [Steinernema carpocapsae]|uniref:Uncharacterized protein n=1 Tax=Steinernema carpocapsae TaxID=34508 RepID=A0A4U5LU96_STECR|nr:hypothetical protein L596_029309 [Steinernema carpocapsae]
MNHVTHPKNDEIKREAEGKNGDVADSNHEVLSSHRTPKNEGGSWAREFVRFVKFPRLQEEFKKEEVRFCKWESLTCPHLVTSLVEVDLRSTAKIDQRQILRQLQKRTLHK